MPQPRQLLHAFVDVFQLQIPLEALKVYAESSVSTLGSDLAEKSEYNDAVSIGWQERCVITSDQATKLREAIQSM